MTKVELIALIEATPARSAWLRGVRDYAVDMVAEFDARDDLADLTEKDLLNGASNWRKYSYGGCRLIYDCDICAALCSPSEQKRKRYGELPPNAREEWLDVQARACRQAATLILDVIAGRVRQ